MDYPIPNWHICVQGSRYRTANASRKYPQPAIAATSQVAEFFGEINSAVWERNLSTGFASLGGGAVGGVGAAALN